MLSSIRRYQTLWIMRILLIISVCTCQELFDDYGRTAGGSCDKTIRNAEEWISSPNYPSDYDNFGICHYNIHKITSDVCQVELTFADFDLEDTEKCYNDYLLLPDGQKLCGEIPTDTKKKIHVPRDTNMFTIRFSTNEEKTRRGFMIRVKQIQYSCGSSGGSGGLTPPEEARLPGPGAVRNPQGASSYCDQDITGYTGILKSPHYPRDYPANLRCRYRIWRANTRVCQIDLEIHDFYVDQEYRGCAAGDYLELPDGSQLCGRISGSKLLKFPPGSDVLTLTFFTDQFHSGRGFHIVVRQRSDSCRAHVGCDQIIDGSSAIVRSPNFPNNYDHNLRCRFTVRQFDPTSCKVQVLFRKFELERSSFCAKDYLEMPDKSRICGRFSGSRTYDFYGRDTMVMYFITDSWRNAFGFEIQVNQLANSCGPREAVGISGGSGIDGGRCDKTLSAISNFIQSPNYPDDYPSNSYCLYTVIRNNPNICRLRMEFIDFDVETANDCSTDALVMEQTGERLCGSRSGIVKFVPFPKNRNDVRLYFTSDHATTRRGFDIKISQETQCTKPLLDELSPDTLTRCGQISQRTGVLESPNHPFPYPPNLDCHYWIYKSGPDNCRAEIFFARFDVGSYSGSLCPTDYVSIQGKKFCGIRDGQTLIVDYPLGEDRIGIRFYTDALYEKSGFRLEVQQLDSGCSTREALQPVALPPATPLESCNEVFARETFKIVSPGYRTGSYRPLLDCTYTVRKSDFKVCALEIKFEAFDLQESTECLNDYVDFGDDQKLCGKQAYGATRTIEFLEDEVKIKFRTDQSIERAGFLMSVTQVKC